MSSTVSGRITTEEQLRELYPRPAPVVRRKVRPSLDEHSRQFVADASLVFLATADPAGHCDVTPRGDAGSVVRVVDDSTLVLPDRPGNNRLDALSNLLGNPHIGMLFVVVGTDHTLRVNGTAEIRTDPELLESFAVDGRRPVSALVITVTEAYLHCGRAFLRAGLWADRPRSGLPGMGELLADQTGADPAERRALLAAQEDTKLY